VTPLDSNIQPHALAVEEFCDAAQSNKVLSKVALRILPLLFTGYLLAFLDRINVGYAQLQMKSDLGFSDAVYGLGAGLFFLSYLIFEVPSNILLERIGARLTLLRIMMFWGLASAVTMFVKTPVQFYVVRLLLGVAEAGFFPGIVLYLTYWFPSSHRGRVTGQFMFAIPVAGLLGGPLSGWIMTAMNGTLGLKGWQWLFVIEGLPTAVLGVLSYLLLQDGPNDAHWLTDEEKVRLQSVLSRDASATAGNQRSHHSLFRTVVLDRGVWILAFVYFAVASALYTYTFWLPTMLRELGLTSVAQIGWYSAVPYAFCCLGVLSITRSSDFFRERKWHIASSLIIGSLSICIAAAYQMSTLTGLAILSLSGFFLFGASIAYWAMPPTYLSKDAASVGIAVISSFGILGGFLSPTLIGFVKTETGSLASGVYGMTAIALAGALAILFALPSKALRVGPHQN